MFNEDRRKARCFLVKLFRVPGIDLRPRECHDGAHGYEEDERRDGELFAEGASHGVALIVCGQPR